MDSLDLSLLATTATDYARDNQDHVFNQLLNPGFSGIPGSPIRPLTDYVTPIPGKDEVVLTEIVIGSVLQPDKREGFTPKNNVVKIKPRKAKVKPCKINLKFTEKQLVTLNKSYYGMIKGPESKLILDRLPVFEAYINKRIIDTARAELRNISLYNGVENINNPSPEGVFDGIRIKIDEALADGEIPVANIATINAITEANAVAEFKKIAKKVPAKYKFSDRLIMVLSPEHLEMYEANYQSTRGALIYNNAYNKRTLEGTMIEFFVEPGMTGADSPFITTLGNICWLYDDDLTTMSLTFDYNKRSEDLAYILKFQAATDFALAEEIWMGEIDD
ncbi:hypothetical protein [Arsenicibacter rosenii]|uniref:Uncharacterized protein n=1 Tax=Arsenicibacter rosenii TaxID=1750698 RepID=A0A1S2VQX1_9BACT|nr:hypothetical protein [Arsenicibacter rosenii]OIN61183.1 hypothetical protein BLX24_03745 [Arsenicibacter rosenii]